MFPREPIDTSVLGIFSPWKQHIIYYDAICLIVKFLATLKANGHKCQVLARALCLASAISFLCFLYLISFEIIGNISLLQMSPLNYTLAILSLTIFLVGYRLAPLAKIEDIAEKMEDGETANLLDQGRAKEQDDAEKNDKSVAQNFVDAKALLILHELKKEEIPRMEEKQESALALREPSQLEIKLRNEIEVRALMRRDLHTLWDELTELRRKYDGPSRERADSTQ